MFSKRGYVPDIRPRECIKKYCPLGGISQYTPKGAGMSCHSISSLLPVNIKKYIHDNDERMYSLGTVGI